MSTKEEKQAEVVKVINEINGLVAQMKLRPLARVIKVVAGFPITTGMTQLKSVSEMKLAANLLRITDLKVNMVEAMEDKQYGELAQSIQDTSSALEAAVDVSGSNDDSGSASGDAT